MLQQDKGSSKTNITKPLQPLLKIEYLCRTYAKTTLSTNTVSQRKYIRDLLVSGIVTETTEIIL